MYKKINIFFMIFLINLVILLFVLTHALGEKAFKLNVNGIHEIYYENSIIKFIIENNNDNLTIFYCTVEKKINNRWREIAYSIDSSRCNKSVLLYKLNPKKSQKQIWDHNNKCFYPTGKIGTFRFVIYIYSPSNYKLIGKVYSKEFIIAPLPSSK